MRRTAESFPYDLPLTLGHEGVGTVAAMGSGISGLRGDDAVAVYGPSGAAASASSARRARRTPPCARRSRHPAARTGLAGRHRRVPAVPVGRRPAAPRTAGRSGPGHRGPAARHGSDCVPGDQAVAAEAGPLFDGCGHRQR
ncbi:alcohol dehydrogenase catalytic domain-containing protein [Streptomyces sp. RP5T]|uniref:alcohol dehydrogenase catalytic domain-containing protein n=1 Tax=Streptomyces sp. RP5T TaxID=2490848 RepID=UPI0034D978D7